MKLLFVVQAVDADSSVLGFILGWIREFAAQCERVEVIAFKTGRVEGLPANVRVHPVTRGGEATRIFSYWKLLRSLLPRVDGVFVHMSPEYAIAAWPQAKLRRKPIVLWYAHRAVTWRLRLGCLVAKKVLSIAPGSMNVRTAKARFLGHGIPTDVFAPSNVKSQTSNVPHLLSVGRVTPIKRLELLIDAVDALRESGVPATLTLVGEPVTGGDLVYADRLRAQARSLGIEDAVVFPGGAPYARLPEIYRSHALHLNAAPTGAPDKAVLEAMACGVPSVAVNETFRALLGPDADALLARPEGEDIARIATALLARPDDGLRGRLRAVVERDHSLKKLIRGIIGTYESA